MRRDLNVGHEGAPGTAAGLFAVKLGQSPSALLDGVTSPGARLVSPALAFEVASVRLRAAPGS